jgi:hypothetical protein
MSEFRDKFIDELAEQLELNSIPDDEVVLADYIALYDDKISKGMTDMEVIIALGDPKDIVKALKKPAKTDNEKKEAVTENLKDTVSELISEPAAPDKKDKKKKDSPKVVPKASSAPKVTPKVAPAPTKPAPKQVPPLKVVVSAPSCWLRRSLSGQERALERRRRARGGAGQRGSDCRQRTLYTRTTLPTADTLAGLEPSHVGGETISMGISGELPSMIMEKCRLRSQNSLLMEMRS